MTTPLGKPPPRNLATEQPDQVSLPTEIGGSVKLSVGIVHPFRTNNANHNNPTIQPTIVHSNQSTSWGHSDWNHFPLDILDSDPDAGSKGSGKNIDK